MRINNIYHQPQIWNWTIVSSLSASTATSRLNIHTYSHRYARRHTHCNLRQASQCMHTYIQASPEEWLTSFLEFRTKQSARPLYNHYETERQNRVLSTAGPEHTLHTHGWPCLSLQLLSHDLTAAVLLFTLEQRKLITVHPISFEMSLSSHLHLLNVCREEGNRPTDTLWWLGGWRAGLASGLLESRDSGGDFIFLYRRPTRVTWACVSEHSRAAGLHWSLASPLGHILCKKSPNELIGPDLAPWGSWTMLGTWQPLSVALT